MPARTRFVDAILLRAVDYGDADRILTLLTAERGKIGVLARAARKSRRRFPGALEPYCVIRAEIGDGRGELDRLAQASVARPFPGILRDLRKISLCGAAMELVREATAEHEPDGRVFGAAVELLEEVDRAGEAREEILLAFTARFLAVVGLAPGLDACAACGRRAADGQAAGFDPVRGGVVCRACGGGPITIGGAARRRLAAATGARWAPDGPWSEREVSDARKAIGEHVRCQLGKRLASSDVLRQIDDATRHGR